MESIVPNPRLPYSRIALVVNSPTPLFVSDNLIIKKKLGGFSVNSHELRVWD